MKSKINVGDWVTISKLTVIDESYVTHIKSHVERFPLLEVITTYDDNVQVIRITRKGKWKLGSSVHPVDELILIGKH